MTGIGQSSAGLDAWSRGLPLQPASSYTPGTGLAAFRAQHETALEQDEVRNTLLLGVLGAAAAAPGAALPRTWTLGVRSTVS